MIASRLLPVLFYTAAVLGLAACGGEIGGSVSGLGADRSVTMLNNATDPLTVNRNGSFAFADTLAAGEAFAVTVSVQPVAQLCTVTDGTGTVNAQGESIDTVRVTCVDVASLTGTLAGLAPGTAVTLNNGASQLPLTVNGPFAFAEVLSDGTRYDVAVLEQPRGATCTVANGAGTFRANARTNVAVTCN